MADSRQDRELIGAGYEIGVALRRHAADRVVGVSPNVEHRDADHAELRADRAASTVRRKRRLSRLLAADYGEIFLVSPC